MKFRAFYMSSKLDQVTVQEQQAYLYVCIDTHLGARLREEVKADTELFGDECLAFLWDEFNLRYPLFIYRLKFFRY